MSDGLCCGYTEQAACNCAEHRRQYEYLRPLEAMCICDSMSWCAAELCSAVPRPLPAYSLTCERRCGKTLSAEREQHPSPLT